MAELDVGDGATLRVESQADTIVVRISGELDIVAVESLRDQIGHALSLAPRHAVIDLEGLSFMDSSGIVVLLRLASRYGTIEIRNASSVIRQLIDATGLREILRVEPD